MGARDYMVVLITARDRAEAESLAESLVTESLAACVNVVGACRSVYRWKGEIVHDDEVLLVVKTSVARFADLERRVHELHSYDVPEVVGLEMAAVSRAYEGFLRDVLG